METQDNIKQVEKDFETVYEKLIDRLDIPGQIKTADCFEMCGIPYPRYTVAFRKIMEIMVEQKKARKIMKGYYEILRANRSNPIYVSEARHNGTVFAN